MAKAILFDLDGTLVDDSMEVFLPPYFTALTKKLMHLIDPEKLIRQLQLSTRAAVLNNSSLTIAEAFAADFFPKIGAPRETLMPLFDDFYAREYPQLRKFVNPIPEACTLVTRAFEKHPTVVIATMPVFPLVAIQKRLEWGHLANFPYTLVMG